MAGAIIGVGFKAVEGAANAVANTTLQILDASGNLLGFAAKAAIGTTS